MTKARTSAFASFGKKAFSQFVISPNDPFAKNFHLPLRAQELHFCRRKVASGDDDGAKEAHSVVYGGGVRKPFTIPARPRWPQTARSRLRFVVPGSSQVGPLRSFAEACSTRQTTAHSGPCKDEFTPYFYKALGKPQAAFDERLSNETRAWWAS